MTILETLSSFWIKICLPRFPPSGPCSAVWNAKNECLSSRRSVCLQSSDNQHSHWSLFFSRLTTLTPPALSSSYAAAMLVPWYSPLSHPLSNNFCQNTSPVQNSQNYNVNTFLAWQFSLFQKCLKNNSFSQLYLQIKLYKGGKEGEKLTARTAKSSNARWMGIFF